MQGEPLIYWQVNKLGRWLTIAAAAFWLLVLSVGILSGEPSKPMDRWLWVAQSLPWLFFLAWSFGHEGLVSCYVLAGGVLLTSDGRTAMRRIPLAGMELTVTGKGCRIRWRQKKIGQSVSLNLPEQFVQRIEESAAVARSAAPGTVPVTGSEAEQAVSMALLQPRLADWWGDRRWLLLLIGDCLWVVAREGALRSIPLSAVSGVERVKRQYYRIQTHEAMDPPLLVNSLFYPDLIPALQRRLAGEPLPVFGEDAGAAAGTGLRCAICGRPEPGVGTGRVAGPDGSYICPTCSDRARYEAGQSGHGLAGKEPRPM